MQALMEDLLTRLQRSYDLLEAYEALDAGLSEHEMGYAQGIREEVRYLERLLDQYVQAPAGVV
jgi:hypothetical protein